MNKTRNVVAGPSKLAEDGVFNSKTPKEQAVADLIDQTQKAFAAIGMDMIVLSVSSQKEWEARVGSTQGVTHGAGDWVALHSARKLRRACDDDPILCLKMLAAA